MAYNGWSNRETWLVNVWFNPETKSDIDYLKDKIESDMDALPDYLKDFINIESIDWDQLESAVPDDDEK